MRTVDPSLTEPAPVSRQNENVECHVQVAPEQQCRVLSTVVCLLGELAAGSDSQRLVTRSLSPAIVPHLRELESAVMTPNSPKTQAAVAEVSSGWPRGCYI